MFNTSIMAGGSRSRVTVTGSGDVCVKESVGNYINDAQCDVCLYALCDGSGTTSLGVRDGLISDQGPVFLFSTYRKLR